MRQLPCTDARKTSLHYLFFALQVTYFTNKLLCRCVQGSMDVMAQWDNILMVKLKWSLREKKQKHFNSQAPSFMNLFWKKKKKNIGRLLNLAQRSRMISTKAWNLLFYAQLNFVTRCAPAVCSALCFCARWAIRNMVIACWAATHTLAATVATCGESTCYNTHIIYFIQGLCHWASSSIVSLGNICKELWVQ